MTIQWGVGLAMVFALFAAGLFAVVVFAMNERVDLVTDNYYEKELRHQERIDEVARTKSRGMTPEVGVTGDYVRITFPSSPESAKAQGEIVLYRPSDRRLDVIVPVQLDSIRTQVLPTSALMKGHWRIQIRWRVGDSRFYHEQAMMLE